MKDKKFLVLIIIAGIWLMVFLGLLVGVRITNPRFEEFITFILIGWFAYWSISTAVSCVKSPEKPSTLSTPETPVNKVNEVQQSQPNSKN